MYKEIHDGHHPTRDMPLEHFQEWVYRITFPDYRDKFIKGCMEASGKAPDVGNNIQASGNSSLVK